MIIAPTATIIEAAVMVVKSLRQYAGVGVEADADILAGALADLGIVVTPDGYDGDRFAQMAEAGRRRERELMTTIERSDRVLALVADYNARERRYSFVMANRD